MTAAAAIHVLHRDIGYLRLRLPPALRTPAVGATIENALRTLAGVQRVTLLAAEGKLAVRFDPQRCSAGAVALRLKSVLADLPAATLADAPEMGPTAAAHTAAITEPAEPAHLGARLDQLRDRVTHAMPERFQPIVASAFTEKAVTNFFNDIVAFYLIRTHWDLITKFWLKNPLKYGNAWLTVFYLVFLLVRYRKS